MSPFRVVVVGGGLGGLCAANGLVRLGLDVIVLERDRDPWARPQGYRINLNRAGARALRQCLPPPHWRLCQATSHREMSPAVEMFSADLGLLSSRVIARPGRAWTPSAVDRSTLRQILADPLGGRVRYGAEVTSAGGGGAADEVSCADGRRFAAELIVAADGASSALRRQLLPGAEPVELPVRGIYGRSRIPSEHRAWLPAGVLNQRFVGVSGGSGMILALGAWDPWERPAEAAARLTPGFALQAPEPYIMWALLVPPVAGPPPGASPAELAAFARLQLSTWNPAVRRLLDHAIEADTFVVAMRAMQETPAWASRHITFLGDAAHVMSPAGGQGANTALADAAALVRALGRVGGRVTLRHAVDAYESGLRARADDALARSRALGAATIARPARA